MSAVPRCLETGNGKMKNSLNGKMVSWLAMFIALSAIGAAIKIPAIIGSVALDVYPALLAAGLINGLAGGIVGAVGHLLSAMLAGFPLGPMHALIAVEMAVLVWIFGLIYKNNMVTASIIFILGNSLVAPLPFIFLLNSGFYFAMVPSLLIGSIINTIIALFAIPRLSNLVTQGIKKRDVKL
jgi:ECF transporter, substrate-specific component